MNNKDVLMAANARIMEGDHEGFLSFCTDDTTWTFVGDITLNGKESVRQWMIKAYEQPPNFKVLTLIADDEYVTALGTISLQDGNGKFVTHDYCDVWRVREQKLAELKAFVIPSSPGS